MLKPFRIQEWFAENTPVREEYLERTGWADADITPVSEDCAMRRYLRLQKGDKTVILLESLPDSHPHATPGHKVCDYIRIGSYLRNAGVYTPEIYDYDEEKGLLLVEDLGHQTFKQALESGVSAKTLYAQATDVLRYMRENVPANGIDLPSYNDSHMHADRTHVINWYWPAVTGIKPTENDVQDYINVWDQIESQLPPVPQVFTHVDFHFENVMWLPENKGLSRCGVIDFQQAVVGPAPYDLANLLEDARMSVPDGIRAAMMVSYCEGMTKEEREIFQSWFRILAAQFHCRVIGLFIRMAVRDGKYGYFPHLPRLAGYMRDNIEDPLLAPLKQWFADHSVSFAADLVPTAESLNASKAVAS